MEINIFFIFLIPINKKWNHNNQQMVHSYSLSNIAKTANLINGIQDMIPSNIRNMLTKVSKDIIKIYNFLKLSLFYVKFAKKSGKE